jgi:hypothetical protein
MTSGASDTIFMNFSVLQLGVQQDRRVAVEANSRTVVAAHAMGGANHDGVINFAFFDPATRLSLFNRHLDDVADAGVTALAAAQHLDAQHRTGTCVIGDFESRFCLNHAVLPCFLLK